MAEHQHTCPTCGYSWEAVETGKTCSVCVSARVNGEGPFCLLCSSIEMFKRAAAHRGITLPRLPWPPAKGGTGA